MGEVITNHPKMIRMWTKRLREVNAKFGKSIAARWAKDMFNAEQIQLINAELNKKNGPPETKV